MYNVTLISAAAETPMRIIISKTNTLACECCGLVPPDVLTQHGDKNGHSFKARTRSNRMRIDPTCWDLPSFAAKLDAAGIPRNWAGKKACHICGKRFTDAMQ